MAETIMNTSEVFTLLAENKNERGVTHWLKMPESSDLESFGIGLTVLRKLAKKIGRNHELAMALWQSNNYDAKVIGLLIDEPKKVTREQAEEQVENLQFGMLTHVFSSCDATLAKTPIAFELAQHWLKHKDKIRRSCAYGLVYEFSKKKNSKLYTDEYFKGCLLQIESTFDAEDSNVQLAMGGALMGIGKRNLQLNAVAIQLATKIGAIPFGDGHCEPFDVLKHLTSDYLKAKFKTT